ncbi:MAG: HAMP domain-containing sensor histidine kinase [Clostridiaceae bacterium]|jgi:signal transduction histidine kinase|nr:HAMP domain-containing sensor histidine kinase [Clostridiaceae bacterium]
MKRNTIKWRIFKYNLIVIITLIVLVAIIFNAAIRIYIEKDIIGQLNKIAYHAEDTALKRGPEVFIFNDKDKEKPPEPPRIKAREDNDIFRFYFMLDRSLREPLSVLNADYILLDNDKSILNLPPEGFADANSGLMDKITTEINKSKDLSKESYLNFHLSGTEYIAIVKPVAQKNNFGLGWIIIYSSLQKVNQLQLAINVILLAILLLSAFIIVLFSSVIAKKISEPFSSLNQHIHSIAERNFGTKINTPVYDELSEFVSNINTMSEKLETYDKAQKTFLQNASHEFRTPLMSIQSYAEGIKYNVAESNEAADIIIDESKRLTQLVENLLYLSRLDAIEENYCFAPLDYNELLRGCAERMNIIAAKNNISIDIKELEENIKIIADEEKLSRAINNILSNCIRFAKSIIEIKSGLIDEKTIRLTISDDGPGFESNEIPNIFDRFFKGSKGNFGLGLAISKNVIEKHKGKITAENSGTGAVFHIDLPIA